MGEGLNIRDMQKAAWQHAEDKGFHAIGDAQHPLTRLMLIVTEIAEAAEECRKKDVGVATYYEKDGKPEGCGIELADAVIRIGDFCEANHIDLDWCTEKKMQFNKTREFMHGGKTA